jgi:invasion protein IalB
MKNTNIRFALMAGAVALGTVSAFAQQPAPAQKAPAAAPAAKAPAAAAAAPAAGAPAAAQGNQSAWVKLCEKAPFVGKDKDGKEERVEKNICLTHHERLDGNSGMVLVSAAVRQIEGVEKQHLMVMVPLGMALPPGMQAAIYPKDMWEKIQKNEKVDDTGLKPIKLVYNLCHSAGCTAEVDATAEMINEIKAGAGLIVYTMNGNGEPIAFPVPLQGFDSALAGGPIDNVEYSKARRALMEQIAQRQQQLIEEYKKQNAELQNMQGNKAFGNAPPAAAGAAPAAKAATPPAATPPPAKK